MMTKAEFDTRWREMFPETQLTPHELRTTYPERWFRIHSLPEAKRYPEDEAEWESLLARQNETITEMIGHGEPFVLVAGDNYWEGLCDLHSTDSLDAYRPYAFTRLDPIELLGNEGFRWQADHRIDERRVERGVVEYARNQRRHSVCGLRRIGTIQYSANRPDHPLLGCFPTVEGIAVMGRE